MSLQGCDSDSLQNIISFLAWVDVLSFSETWRGGKGVCDSIFLESRVSRRDFVEKMRKGEKVRVRLSDGDGRVETTRGVCLIGEDGVMRAAVEREVDHFFPSSNSVLLVASSDSLHFENRLRRRGGKWEGEWRKQGKGELRARVESEGCFLVVSCSVSRKDSGGDWIQTETTAASLFFSTLPPRKQKRFRILSSCRPP